MPSLAYSDRYLLNLPEGHRFPITKYELIRDQLLHEGTAGIENFYDPGLCHEEDLLRVHTQEYWEKVRDLKLSPQEVRKIGLPLNERLVLRSLSSSCGTVQAALRALRDGVAFNVAGGTHHAFTDHGEGFCVFNDIAIASRHLLHHQLVRKILVVDLDVHQGNGTAEIFRRDDRVFTFSMHGADNYPLKKEKSDLDIALPVFTGDDAYLNILRDTLPRLIARVKPGFIFFQAGVDVLATDKLGKLSLTRQGCKTRDEVIFSICLQYSIPVAVSMGGGYSEHIKDIVEAHCNTFRVAFGMY